MLLGTLEADDAARATRRRSTRNKRPCNPMRHAPASAAADVPRIPTGPGEPLVRGSASWRGLPVAIWPIPDRGEMVDHERAIPVLLVARSGLGRRWYRSGTVRRELQTVPGMIEVYG